MIKKINLYILFALCLVFWVPMNAHATLFMSVSGKVVSADNGAGLSGVKILLMSQYYPEKGKVSEAKSNAQGIFVLRDVPAGMYDIWAISETPFVVSSKTVVPVTVPDGKNVVGIAIKLQRGGGVKGKVVTSTGIPIPQATVLGNGGISATTANDGSFALTAVTPGTVNLAVSAPGIAAKAVSAVCEAGKVVDIGTITLPIGAESTIRGNVVDATGNPIPGAVVVASAPNSTGGYSIASDTGAFLITGLATTTKFKLNVVAFGYEPLKLLDIPVPSSDLRIVLTPATNTTATLIKYMYVAEKSDVEVMYKEMIVPAASDCCTKGSCPDGYWGGVSIDVTPMINVPGVSLSGGGSFSIGSYVCFSYRSYFGFSQTCNYGGAAYDVIASLGVGVSGTFVKSARCGENILNPSTDGAVYSVSLPRTSFISYYGLVALDANNLGVKYVTLSGGVSFSTPSLEWRTYFAEFSRLQQIGRAVAYRHCSSQEYNIFELLLR